VSFRLKARSSFERYLDILAIVAACVLLGALTSTGVGALDTFVLFGLLVAIAELGQVVLWPGNGVSLGNSIALSAGYLYGPASAGWAQALGGLVAGLALGSPWRILLGNVSIFVLSAIGAAASMGFLAEGGMPTWISLAGGVSVSLLINSSLVTGAIALSRQARFLHTWLDVVAVSAPWHLLGVGIAFALVQANRFGGTAYVAAFCLVAIAVNRALLPGYARLARERAVRTLLRAARVGDDYRHGHSRRVLQYAAAIGSVAKLSRKDQ
jgi:hypothetical protein